MQTQSAKIVNKLGIHARSASKFVSLAKTYSCQIQIGTTEDDLQNGKSIMGVLSLAAERGSTVVLKTDGREEDDAMQALQALIANKFDEPE